MILVYIELILSFIMLGGCGISYRSSMKRLTATKSTIDYLVDLAQREQEAHEEELARRKREEELQKNRVFQLNFKIMHGSAFGGCSAIAPDGRHRKGSISLDQIKMFGKNSAGHDFTYYIEDQEISILANDEADSLTIVSHGSPFEIRENNENRDQGVSVTKALIKKGILYYIILESKHEVSICATAD